MAPLGCLHRYWPAGGLPPTSTKQTICLFELLRLDIQSGDGVCENHLPTLHEVRIKASDSSPHYSDQLAHCTNNPIEQTPPVLVCSLDVLTISMLGVSTTDPNENTPTVHAYKPKDPNEHTTSVHMHDPNLQTSTSMKVNLAPGKDDKLCTNEFNDFELKLLDSAREYQNEIERLTNHFEKQLQTMANTIQSICQRRNSEVLELNKAMASLEQHVLQVESRALHRNSL